MRGFLPLPSSYAENASKYGYAHFGQGETINTRNYSCPNCGASDRERLFALYIGEWCKTLTSRRLKRPSLLHFAPEPALLRYLRELDIFDYRTADLLDKDVDDQIDITQLDIYTSGSFDSFICSHVLEHVQHDMQAMKELHRILKPGGWGILMAPIVPYLDQTVEDPGVITEADRWRLFGQGDHVRLYAKQDYLHRITDTGFNIKHLDVDHFGRDVFTGCGITQQSVLYVVSHD